MEFPNGSGKNRKNIGLARWLKIIFLILGTIILTWYGKYYTPKPSLTYINEFAVWIFPHKNGLSALVALPNDKNDSNTVRTGLRIWLSPPDSLLALERISAIRYRGKNILAIGDTMSEQLRQDMLSTLDSSGNLFWMGPLNTELTGEDVFAELKLVSLKAQDYIFDLIYEGHKIRFFGSEAALDSSETEPLGVAILMFNPKDEKTLPLQNNELIQSLIWNGKNAIDSSRLAMDYPETMAVISFNKKRGLIAKKLLLIDWQPQDFH